jgi:hypothetical protein
MFQGWSHSDYLALASILASLAMGVAIVIATVRGPIIATREADARRAASDRRSDKMRVFRELMGHRYNVTHPNYVAALNLVQIEFPDVVPVMNALSSYLAAFHPDRSIRPDCAETRQKAIIRLLTALANDLGYELEQLDVMQQVYAPQGWANEAEQQSAIRNLFAEIASGKRALPVLTIIPQTFVEDLGNDRSAVRTVQPPTNRGK